ncbi:fructoselysine 6-kinase [Streptococcus dysgalactiae]|uniref:Fructoselysine 6-kinase n=1 Tax=Streptococcus dysgalactiae TaxID=1334 RepID=A0AAE9UMG4_STRDY|nr:fructoselysine 6-kinase [Streptococcus dysgalactiae]WAI93317.1 fructoselysine 6-kinase [Streptococcus dysgalactiae]
MKLAAIGSNCIDYYKNLEGGKAFPGGGPVNMAVYNVRIGGQASYIGPVGNDEYGELLKNSLQDRGVNTSHMEIKYGDTAVSEVELIDGERVFGDYTEGVLEDYKLSEEDILFILKHDIVVCDLWGKVESSFEKLQDLGIKTAFDCADRPEDNAVQRAIAFTNYLFFSTDEEDSEDLRLYMKKLWQAGPELVIAMQGEYGSICYDGERYISFGIIDCENVIDTMGAGDSYIAGFLNGKGNDLPIEECMKQGATVATETIQYFGAW